MKLADIARLAEVSVTTASYVINGQAAKRRIAAATVERVLAVVAQYDYRPDPQAAGLRSGQSKCLGFILPDLENPSYARIAKLLEQGARAAGYQLLIASSDDNAQSERQLIELFRSRRCDALIVASCLAQDEPIFAQLIESGMPVIAVDRALDAATIRSVVSDDQHAGAQLTHTLLARKPRHIALIGGRAELAISQARELGFRQAVAGSDALVSVVNGEQFSRPCGEAQMLRLINSEQGLPDAIVTTAYVLLEGVLDALQSVAPSQSQDLQLATFGDTQLLDFLPWRVNTIAQQHQQIAEKVLYWALQAIEHNHYSPGIEAIARTLKIRQ
ncbi:MULTISPECIES: catabolite repressor/activator [Pseudomonas]|uniref:catabolite repressor/activator n=1 Tax=Pseudomonas TaxID=286 RepID=UPI0008EB47E7|nr:MULTISPECIES: catabolite repressor/activator [Pseudomonas]NRH27234.1 catabolite repressor/activator [Pseudomonas sp. MS19]SFT64233.1 transcriptional regulator, LacI family [Pseudomonas marincola]